MSKIKKKTFFYLRTQAKDSVRLSQKQQILKTENKNNNNGNLSLIQVNESNIMARI